jgi:hypothetical protein
MHDRFQEEIKRSKNQIIQKSLGAIKPIGLIRITKLPVKIG